MYFFYFCIFYQFKTTSDLYAASPAKTFCDTILFSCIHTYICNVCNNNLLVTRAVNIPKGATMDAIE